MSVSVRKSNHVRILHREQAHQMVAVVHGNVSCGLEARSTGVSRLQLLVCLFLFQRGEREAVT